MWLSHEVSTFLGVRRMVFDLSDFSGAEREEVRTAWQREGVFVGFFNSWCGSWCRISQVSKILHSQGISVQGGADGKLRGQTEGGW